MSVIINVEFLLRKFLHIFCHVVFKAYELEDEGSTILLQVIGPFQKTCVIIKASRQMHPIILYC
jgi:hypothetical protein